MLLEISYWPGPAFTIGFWSKRVFLSAVELKGAET